MSPRFKNELFFLSTGLTWGLMFIAVCAMSHWYWFVLGWVVVAGVTASYERLSYNRRHVQLCERLSLGCGFLLHLGIPLMVFLMMRRLPQDYRDWRNTPPPGHKNYAWPRDCQ